MDTESHSKPSSVLPFESTYLRCVYLFDASSVLIVRLFFCIEN